MKTWLITGASSGIGYGIAQAAMERGDKAIIAARSEDKLQALADRFPGQAQVLVLDVSDAGSIAQAMTQIADRLDDVDVLVKNPVLSARPFSTPCTGRRPRLMITMQQPARTASKTSSTTMTSGGIRQLPANVSSI